MSDSKPERDVLPEDTAPGDVDRATTPRRSEQGFDGERTRRTNPHDEEGSVETAARTGGLMTAMFFPVVILVVVAIILIVYFFVMD